MSPDAIRSLASVFRRHGLKQPLQPATALEERYAQVLGRLGKEDAPGALRGVDFRPFLLLNGLLVAARQDDGAARLTCRALALGLETFAEYFALRTGEPVKVDGPKEQQRYFAFVIAQLPECGAPLDAVFATMKGDALDQGTAYEVRELLEGGPDAVLRSSLFDEAERAAWKLLFEGAPGAWDALRDLLVHKWALRLERTGAHA